MATIQAGDGATVAGATRVTAMEALEARLRGRVAEQFNRETEAIVWLERAFRDYEAVLKWASNELVTLRGHLGVLDGGPTVDACRRLAELLREKVNNALYRNKVS